jgi:signal transduction histidine kinase
MEYISTVKTCGDILLYVVNDLIDFNQMESGKLTLTEQIFDLRECFREVGHILEVNAQKKVRII